MAHILFVCTANICRSPVAEGLLRERLRENGLESWQVSSAGTWARFQRSAAKHSIDVLGEQGIDISSHRAREVTGAMLEEADLILCMETGHAEALRAEFPEIADKIHLLTEMAGHPYSVEDPYGGPRSEFEQMVGELSDLLERGLPRITELARENARKHT
ncbi:MAG: hypothetical protein R3272_02560 [Candidatus Promineifilaceae bacterium]|nr:hypothetical protein [Candidatus Promineifilaceae bacterium]